jgi:hypothetical protein
MTLPARRKEKITREKLVEILKANISIYKGEENFHEYLADLVVYLLTYEYEWPRDEMAALGLMAEPAKPADENVVFNKGVLPGSELGSRERKCPYCGNRPGRDKICPTCLIYIG